MILINLLPHREEARKRAKETFYAHLGLAAIIGVIISGIIYIALDIALSAQLSRNDRLRIENASLDRKITEVVAVQATINSLQARREAVENLQTDRNLIIRWMEDIARMTPEGVYLTQIVQKGLELTIDGIALNNENISLFMKQVTEGVPFPGGFYSSKTLTNAQWFGAITAKTMQLRAGEPDQRVLAFSLRFDLVRDLPERNEHSEELVRN